MKLFIVVETYSDDDGNLGTILYPCKSEEEAFKKVKEVHDETLNNYTNYNGRENPDNVYDDYEDGDSCCELGLEDDYDTRTVISIRELDI